MYCRNCGKQIEDDSVFCKYCGKTIVSETPLSKNKGISTRFLELSKGKQIALIVYGIWFLIWLCILIANANSYNFTELYVMLFFLCTIVIPFAIAGGWHIYKIIGVKKESNAIPNIDNPHLAPPYPQLPKETDKAPKEKQPSSAIEPEVRPQRVATEVLLNFARNNGKMQVINKKISDGNYDRYCQFTSEDGKTIRVEFADRIGFLSSKEISEKKYQLSVDKLSDGTYCLDLIEDKQIEDSLPF